MKRAWYKKIETVPSFLSGPPLPALCVAFAHLWMTGEMVSATQRLEIRKLMPWLGISLPKSWGQIVNYTEMIAIISHLQHFSNKLQWDYSSYILLTSAINSEISPKMLILPVTKSPFKMESIILQYICMGFSAFTEQSAETDRKVGWKRGDET